MAYNDSHYISNPDGFAGGVNAQPCGPIRWEAPIPGQSTRYVFQQDFMCLANNFASIPLNTPYAFDGALDGYLLVHESEGVGEGDCIRWTRTYASVPATHTDPTSVSYTFVQFGVPTIVGGNTIWPQGTRPPIQDTVYGDIVSEYFLLEPDESPITIPAIPAFTAYANQVNAVARNITTTVLLGEGLDPNTNPTIEEYVAMIGTQIVAQPSTVERWHGCIFVRRTIYIKAQ